MFEVTALELVERVIAVLVVSMTISLVGYMIVDSCVKWFFDHKKSRVRKRVAEYERAKNELADTERKIRQFETQLGSDSTVVRLQMIKRSALLDTLHDYKRRYGKYL